MSTEKPTSLEFALANEAADRLIDYLESVYETPGRPPSHTLGAILVTIAKSAAHYLREYEPDRVLARRAADAFLVDLRSGVTGFPAPANLRRFPIMPQPANPIPLDQDTCETVDHTLNSCPPSTRVMVLLTIAGAFIASADDVDAAYAIFGQALQRDLPSAGH